MAPRAPAPVAFGPCPPGWTSTTDEGIEVCLPWSTFDLPDCPPDQARFPGDDGCVPIAPPCPIGEFADGLPASGVRFVQAGAIGGDGTRDRPYGRIADAAAGAPPGTVIALAGGTYAEVVRLGSDLTLWGACPTATVLAPGSTTTTRAVIDVVGARVVIRDLTIGPSPVPAVYVSGPGRSASIHGVIVTGTPYGIFAYTGAEVTVERTIARDTDGYRRMSGLYGNGFDAEEGGSLILRRVVAEGNESGLFVGGALATAHAEDSVFRRSVATMQAGVGVGVVGAGQVTLTRVVAEQNDGTGIAIVHAGTRATLDTVVVRDTLPSMGATPGIGYEINLGASVSGRRVLVEGGRYAGIVADANSHVDLEDLVIRDVLTELEGRGGMGVLSEDGSLVQATRVALLRNRYAAAEALLGASIRLTDAWVIGSRPRPDGAGGFGALAIDAEIVVDGASFERNTAAAVRVLGERGRLDLDDLTIRDTEAGPTGAGGNALVAQAPVIGRRWHLTGNREASVLIGNGGDLRVEDVSVDSTRPRECATTTCRDAPAGSGLVVHSGGGASLTRFALSSSPLCGVQVGPAGSIDLAQGAIRECAIGACVQVAGYDLARVASASVVYADNGVAVDAENFSRPIPEIPAE